MNLSDFAINEFVPLIIGDKKGKDLVAFFNKFGARDVYDEFGLPDIKKNNGARPSKREYVLKRAKELNGKPELRDLIINVVCQYPKLLDKCNEILIHEKFQIVNQNGEIIVIGGVIDKRKPVVNEACFQDIQNRLLEQLNKARVSITVVMAWFTNETLFQKLLDKQEQGVDVKIAIYDDGVNKKHGVNIDLLPIVNKIKHGKRGGLMHDKFCIIDNQIVITGSYNWSSNAEFRNDENITIQQDPEQATRYSEEYRRLIT